MFVRHFVCLHLPHSLNREFILTNDSISMGKVFEFLNVSKNLFSFSLCISIMGPFFSILVYLILKFLIKLYAGFIFRLRFQYIFFWWVKPLYQKDVNKCLDIIGVDKIWLDDKIVNILNNLIIECHVILCQRLCITIF